MAIKRPAPRCNISLQAIVVRTYFLPENNVPYNKILKPYKLKIKSVINITPLMALQIISKEFVYQYQPLEINLTITAFPRTPVHTLFNC